MIFPTAKALESRRAEAYDGFLELIARAQASGNLRPDFPDRDLVILFMANAGVIAATGDAAPAAWRRLVGYMLRAFATPGTKVPPLPPAPEPRALYRAMIRLTRPSPAADSPRGRNRRTLTRLGTHLSTRRQMRWNRTLRQPSRVPRRSTASWIDDGPRVEVQPCCPASSH
ncbi:hypothetical protein [Nocardia salmonicida]|uniref:hypothetical protein n=1 Tax=Nocardia salmonicida TaxID=53431 RepID=UPI0033C46276